MTKKEALEIVGGLSTPSKMPGYSFNIPASKCKRGSALSKIEGTICSKCYAQKNRYRFGNVQKALNTRFLNMTNVKWIDAMITLIENEKYFRWFDSGDIQDEKMLEQIIAVCNGTPECKHWLPTREIYIVKSYIDNGNVIPKNLNIRISSDFIKHLPNHFIENCTYSTVGCDDKSSDIKMKIINCPATFDKEKHKCDEHKCYKCWDKKIDIVNYKEH